MFFLYNKVYLEKERGRLSYFSNKMLSKSDSKHFFSCRLPRIENGSSVKDEHCTVHFLLFQLPTLIS